MSDYAHARHAGNLGDVLKHIALTAVLREAAREHERLLYVESHAADGLFPLGAVGEWGEGVQRLWDLPKGKDAPAPEGPTAQYRALLGRFSRPSATRPEAVPGSPLLAQALLPASARPGDELVLHQLDETAARVLRGALGADGRAQVLTQDGFEGAARAVTKDVSRRAVVLIDPPYSDKAEWAKTAEAVTGLYREAPLATLLVWYPIKAMTRPVALLNALAEGGVHGTAVELVATPLRLRREKLNGTGMILLRSPPAALAALCAELPLLGPLLATRGEWTARLFGF